MWVRPEAPKRSFTQVGPGLDRKHWARLEKLATHKHSSLSRKSVNYGRNKFYSPGFNVIKLFSFISRKSVNYGRNKFYSPGFNVIKLFSFIADDKA